MGQEHGVSYSKSLQNKSKSLDIYLHIFVIPQTPAFFNDASLRDMMLCFA